jgi:hypothetical protein
MCRISDFLIPKRAEERAEVGWGEIKEERSKRRIIVMALAKEELIKIRVLIGKKNLIISFCKPRRWYHRFIFMPTRLVVIIFKAAKIPINPLAYYSLYLKSLVLSVLKFKNVAHN